MAWFLTRLYVSHVWQEGGPLILDDWYSDKLPIRFEFYKVKGWLDYPDDNDDDDDDYLHHITYQQPKFKKAIERMYCFREFADLNKRGNQISLLNSTISALQLANPVKAKLATFEKLFQVIEGGVPSRRIVVVLHQVKVKGSADTNRRFNIATATTPSFVYEGVESRGLESRGLGLESRGLERVTLDSLEPTEHKSSCVICMENFLGFHHGEATALVDNKAITRLPCLHLYHRHCIVRWLRTNRLCPMCRRPVQLMTVVKPKPPERSRRRQGPMPIVEVGEPSEPSSLDWPELLITSAGVIMSTLVLTFHVLYNH